MLPRILLKSWATPLASWPDRLHLLPLRPVAALGHLHGDISEEERQTAPGSLLKIAERCRVDFEEDLAALLHVADDKALRCAPLDARPESVCDRLAAVWMRGGRQPEEAVEVERCA